MILFRDKDSEYRRWLVDHPKGFVVNALRIPTPEYLVLHQATCPHITRLARNAKTWTEGGFIKVCADDVRELQGWASHVSGQLQSCGACKP
jgi:hypothetical protein